MVEFLLGGMFLYIILPILESIMSVICSALEILKAKCNLKITEYNSKISQINYPKEDIPVTQPIGFYYTPVEKEDEEEYED